MTSEDVRGQVSPSLTTKRTLGDDPGIRYRVDRRENLLRAAFAADREVAEPGHGQVEHSNRIGDNKANMQARAFAAIRRENVQTDLSRR